MSSSRQSTSVFGSWNCFLDPDGRFPEYGVPLLRELIEPPYRIVYEVFTDRVEIVIVRHGQEDFKRQARS